MLKRFILMSLIVIPALALSQPDGMNQEQMQKLMQGAMQMQACMAEIDQDQLEAIGNEAEAMQSELKRMCSAGDRDGAQAKAMAFGVKMAQSDAMKQLRSCGEMAMAMMPSMMDYIDSQAEDGGDSNADKHVCDHL